MLKISLFYFLCFRSAHIHFSVAISVSVTVIKPCVINGSYLNVNVASTLHVFLFPISSLRQQEHKPQALWIHMNRPLSFSFHSQTDEERQQALQAFTAQSFLTSPQQNISSCGSGASAPAFPSPTSSSDHRTKMKRGPRKNQNEKYRLKYLRLRRAARAMIFVSAQQINEKLCKYCNVWVIQTLRFTSIIERFNHHLLCCCIHRRTLLSVMKLPI